MCKNVFNAFLLTFTSIVQVVIKKNGAQYLYNRGRISFLFARTIQKTNRRKFYRHCATGHNTFLRKGPKQAGRVAGPLPAERKSRARGVNWFNFLEEWGTISSPVLCSLLSPNEKVVSSRTNVATPLHSFIPIFLQPITNNCHSSFPIGI